jgi:hypothetical protein
MAKELVVTLERWRFTTTMYGLTRLERKNTELLA